MNKVEIERFLKYKYSMLKKLSVILLLVLLSSIDQIYPELDKSGDFMTGKITNIVKCSSDADETYSLYLPESYTPEKKWPVIIAFEPAARAMIPVKLFRNSAEKYGYIVVCSNNSKNGPWIDVIRSMKAVWTDLNKRFSINRDRVYTTGFSGGARAAALFGEMTGTQPAGIIGCGAGLPSKLPPEKIKNSFYYGIIGLEDFNYKEFIRLGPQLKKAGVRYCIDYINGIHKWPDEEVINRALSWMEIDSVLREGESENLVSVRNIFRNLREYADSLLNSESFYYGVLYLDHISRHFKMLLPVDELEKKVKDLKKEKKFSQFVREDDLRLKKEYQFIRNFIRVFNRIDSNAYKRLGLQSVLNDLKLPYLVKLERKKKKPFYSYLATRLLYEIAVKAERSGSNQLKKGDGKKAVLYAEIASRTGVNKDWYDFRLASVYAASGKKKKCIRIIKSLLRSNKDLIKYIEVDPDFNELLKDPEFMKVFINKK